MTDFQTDAEAAVAELIATLPDDFGKLTLPQVEAIHAAHTAIMEIKTASNDAQQAILDRIVPRLTSPTQTIGEVATAAEIAEVDGLNRRYLMAERAGVALDAWEDRAGAARYGIPPREDHEPVMMEDPDGTLTIGVERRPNT